MKAGIGKDLRTFVEEGYAKAEEILTQHMDQLHRVAQYLIANEKVDSAGFEALMRGEDPSGGQSASETPSADAQDAPSTDAPAQDETAAETADIPAIPEVPELPSDDDPPIR